MKRRELEIWGINNLLLSEAERGGNYSRRADENDKSWDFTTNRPFYMIRTT
jgi:hypothetical protein